MKILISLSATSLELGTRVAVEFDKNDWSVGTVVGKTRLGYKIDFDFGEQQYIKEGIRISVVDRPRKLKRSITYAEVRALKPKRAAVQKPVVRKLVQPKPVAPEPKAAVVEPTSAAPKPEQEPKQTASSEGDRLAALVGNKAAFENVRSIAERRTQGSMLKAENYLWSVWNKANRLLFDGKLEKPILIFKKVMDARTFRGLGHWSPRDRKLAINPRLFNGNEATVLTTFVHEMCHQAVSEIDRTREGNGGHGPKWESWMRKCGLTPSRYSTDDHADFLTEREAAEREQRIQNHKHAMETAQTRKLRPSELSPNLPAQFFDSQTNAWLKGLIVWPNDKAGKRWAFMPAPTNVFRIVPADMFHALPEDHGIVFDEAWFRASLTIKNYVEGKQLQRSAARKV